MLIWGSSSMRLKHQASVEGQCTACGHTAFVLHGIQRYGHVWWIPFFPTSKVFLLTCLNCNSTLSNDKAEELVHNVNSSNFKTPVGCYAWFFIIACLIPLFIIFPSNSSVSEQQENYETKYTWDSIKKNDLLIFHDKKEFGYLLARVLKMEDDKVTFQLSKYIYKRKSRLTFEAYEGKEVFKDIFYHDDYYETTIDEMKKEFQLEEIVSRKDHASDSAMNDSP